jgi:hypothetical protein
LVADGAFADDAAVNVPGGWVSTRLWIIVPIAMRIGVEDNVLVGIRADVSLA